MSERSLRRRRSAQRSKAARRRRRAALAGGAVLGAGVIFAPAAGAAGFKVDVLTDGAANSCVPGACTLRDAVAASNSNSEPDVISFAPGLSGTITLTQGALSLASTHGVSIAGPGQADIAISGDANGNHHPGAADSRIFTMDDPGLVHISGLTLREGFATEGGAILARDPGLDLRIHDTRIVDSATSGRGGAVFVEDGAFRLMSSIVTGNSAAAGGAFYGMGRPSLHVEDSAIADNTAANGLGGAVALRPRPKTKDKYLPQPPHATFIDTTITGNSARRGGAIDALGAHVTLREAEVSGNFAVEQGGGLSFQRAGALVVEDSTVSGNDAGGSGGGIVVDATPRATDTHKYSGWPSSVAIAGTTISNNASQGSGGGVAMVGGEVSLSLSSSTVSGNGAATGGGLALRGDAEVANSTIANNDATVAAGGGGMYLGDASGVPVSSTIVADNSAAGTADDLATTDPLEGGFRFGNSLVEVLGGARYSEATAGSNIFDRDPALGSLADNGGPTLTQMPGNASPVLDVGLAGGRTTDQRGLTRIVDLPADDGAGDGTDMGAVEVGALKAPETSFDAGPSGVIAGRTATFAFSADELGATFGCRLDGGAWHPCTSPHQLTNLADGPHAFEVRATDQAGLTDPSPASRSFTVNNQPPNTTIDSGPSGVISAGAATFAFRADEQGATFGCRLDGGAWHPCTSPHGVTNLTAGVHTFEVRSTARDLTDSSPASRTFEVRPADRTPPDTKVTKAPGAKVFSKRRHVEVSIAFTSTEQGSTFECSVDSGPYRACTSPLSVKAKTKRGRGAKHTIRVRAIDAAGNVDPTPSSVVFRAIRR